MLGRQVKTLMGMAYAPGINPMRVRLTFNYDPDAPYEVVMDIEDPAEAKDGKTWTISRDVLREGISKPAGMGDVFVAPYMGERDGRDLITVITLSSDDGTCALRFKTRELRPFLTLSFAAVPAGTESERLDIDAAILKILGHHEAPGSCEDD